MPMDPVRRSMLSQTINVRSVLENQATDDETLSLPVPMAAYVEYKRVSFPVEGGMSSGIRPFIVTETPVLLDDRVWLPGDDPTDLTLGKKPMDVAEFRVPFGVGVDHYEVIL